MGSTEQPTRHLAWDACYNIRDLGGYVTEDGGQTRWRAVVRADNLCSLAPAGRDALIAYGVRTIIDLRHHQELREARHPFAHLTTPDATPTYLHLPLEEWGNPEYGAALRQATREAIYTILLAWYPAQMAAIARAIARAPAGGVLIHCHAGKDRTGVVAAMLLALAGVPTSTIVDDYALSNIHLRSRYAALLKQARDDAERAQWEPFVTDPQRAAPPGRMLTTLAWLDEQYGGVRPYLLAAGVTEGEIERLRARLRDC
jgi:protein-tyrosine phosphatase